MCSPESVILASIVTILVSFEAILIYFKAYCRKITLKFTTKVDIYRNPLQNASKLTSIVTILASIALAGEHIFHVLAQYL